MTLRCSILGHNYGASEVEREREEDGSEVITTVRETETCVRCGETRVVSENKEVTTLETAADIVAEDLDPSDGSADARAGARGAGPAEPDSVDTEATPDSDVGPETSPESGAETDADPETTPDPAPEPDVETPIPDAEEGAPNAGTPPTDPAEDDGVILEDTTDETSSERAPGEWPEEPDDGDDEWEPETTPVHDDDPDIERTGNAVTVPEGSFHCPECDFSTPVEESSLRAGDFCPECHRGALEHQPE